MFEINNNIYYLSGYLVCPEKLARIMSDGAMANPLGSLGLTQSYYFSFVQIQDKTCIQHLILINHIIC